MTQVITSSPLTFGPIKVSTKLDPPLTKLAFHLTTFAPHKLNYKTKLLLYPRSKADAPIFQSCPPPTPTSLELKPNLLPSFPPLYQYSPHPRHLRPRFNPEESIPRKLPPCRTPSAPKPPSLVSPSMTSSPRVVPPSPPHLPPPNPQPVCLPTPTTRAPSQPQSQATFPCPLPPQLSFVLPMPPN